MSTTLTTRDHLTAISNGNITEETKAWAAAQIEKLNARNAKRAEKPSKTAVANAPLKEALLKYLTENDGKFTAMELAPVIEGTHNKASALARQLVTEGKVKSEEVKIPKVGKRIAYFVEK